MLKNVELIDGAIDAHLNWVRRFRGALEGSSPERLDPSVVRNDQACSLGQWLHAGAGRELLDEDLLGCLKVIHATFHEVAYLLAILLETTSDVDERTGLISGLSNMSEQIVSILTLAKSRVSALN